MKHFEKWWNMGAKFDWCHIHVVDLCIVQLNQKAFWTSITLCSLLSFLYLVKKGIWKCKNPFICLFTCNVNIVYFRISPFLYKQVIHVIMTVGVYRWNAFTRYSWMSIYLWCHIKLSAFVDIQVLVQGDILINTSLTEAFCIAIVEAACCGSVSHNKKSQQ